MLPVAVQVPVAGSYNSALDKAPLLKPPAASTFPLESNVSANDSRPVVILPVAVHVPVAGLYSSALARGGAVQQVFGSKPPATSTSPSASRVVVWLTRGTFMLPVLLNPPEPARAGIAMHTASPRATKPNQGNERIGFEPTPDCSRGDNREPHETSFRKGRYYREGVAHWLHI